MTTDTAFRVPSATGSCWVVQRPFDQIEAKGRLVPRVPTVEVVAEPLLRLGASPIEARARAEALLARITPVADYAPFAEADLIIEAATEREEIKNAIFDKAGKVL
ncbi:MAG: 3-hydroxyacyl-CoA dehydrogenase NAD-binding domain-containing protein, partial [Candidatus Sericytochromatia bacterium]